MAGPTGQAITLDQYAKFANNPLITAATMSLYDTTNVMKDIPLRTIPTIKVNGARYTFLNNSAPNVNWVPLNTDPVLTQAIPVPWEEQLYLVRNGFRLDKRLKDDKNQYTDPLKSMFDAWMKALAYDFNYKFLYNDHVTGDANAPVGINTRLVDPAYESPSDLLIDAGGVDMSSALTSSTANRFINVLQSAFDHLGAFDGENCVIYCGDSLVRAFEQGVRALGSGGGFSMTKDAFDRDIPTYKQAKIRYIGRKMDQVTQIITPTELATGAQSTSGTYTSLYVVRYDDDHLHGWQPESLKPTYLGLNPITGVTYNVVVDWGIGLIQQDIRSFARVYDIKVSP